MKTAVPIGGYVTDAAHDCDVLPPFIFKRYSKCQLQVKRNKDATSPLSRFIASLKSVDSTLGTPDPEALFFHSHPLPLTSPNQSTSPADFSLEGAGAHFPFPEPLHRAGDSPSLVSRPNPKERRTASRQATHGHRLGTAIVLVLSCAQSWLLSRWLQGVEGSDGS